jgi:hypothetical protein
MGIVRHCCTWAILRQAEAAATVPAQIARASSSNATATRWLTGRLERQLVVAAAEVLDACMPNNDDSGVAILLETVYRSQPRLQPAVVALDEVVGVPVGAVPARREQLVQHDRKGGRLVGDDLHGRDLGLAGGLLEEPPGGGGITTRGDDHGNDLAELVDRVGDIPPLPSDLHVGLIDAPASPDPMAAWSGGLGEQRCEPLDPSVDSDVVHLDAALGNSSSASR